MVEESAMDNLTLSLKVAKPHTIDPLEGHTVVIFERVGDAGEEFRFEIVPGQTLPAAKRTLFEVLRGKKQPNYFAYAVTRMPELRWTFTTDVTLDIQAHSFTLLVTLAYSVSEPDLLVTRRNDDPIRQVRDYISGLLSRQFAQRTWGEIRHDFRDVEREVVAGAITPVRQFAAYFGLHIHDLSLSHRLQEIDFKHILEQEAARTAAETETVKADLAYERLRKVKENEQELAILDRDHDIDRRSRELLVASHRRDDMLADALADAMAGVIKGAQTPEDLIQTVNKIRGSGNYLPIGDGNATTRRRLASGGDGQNSVAIKVAEALDETERMGFDRKRKERLQSAILHLLAELLLDGEGDGAALTAYASRIDDFRHEPKLSKPHGDYLREFVRFESLRDALR